SHLLARDGRALIRNWRERPGRTASSALSSRSKASATPWARRAPSAVSRTDRLKRSNRRRPRRISSAFTWRLTAPGVTPSSSAASRKLPWRAAASNARSATSGGVGRRSLMRGSRLEAVAAGVGQQQPRLTWLGLDLLTQAVDVGFQRVGGDPGVVAPHLGQQLFARHRLGPGAIEVLQDVGFLFRQPDLLALVVHHQLGGRTELIGTDLEDGVLGLFVAAQMGADARQQDGEPERLGD